MWGKAVERNGMHEGRVRGICERGVCVWMLVGGWILKKQKDDNNDKRSCVVDKKNAGGAFGKMSLGAKEGWECVGVYTHDEVGCVGLEFGENMGKWWCTESRKRGDLSLSVDGWIY